MMFQVQGNSEPGDGDVNEYNYVITIDGLSTVFSDPVRITEGNGDGDPREQQPEAVPVITGDLLNDPKSSSVQETYTLSAGGDKVSPSPDQRYHLTTGRIDQSHHLYDPSTNDKIPSNQGSFADQRESQTTVETSSEFAAHSASQEVHQTVLVNQKSPRLETVVATYQGHGGVPSKLPKTE